jgi:hypothetical protein
MPESANSIPIEDALDRLVVDPAYDCGHGPEPCVHTFLSGAIGLIGAHWSLASVREAMEAHGVEEAGEMATGMGHGLVILRPVPPGPLFLEARPPGVGSPGSPGAQS